MATATSSTVGVSDANWLESDSCVGVVGELISVDINRKTYVYTLATYLNLSMSLLFDFFETVLDSVEGVGNFLIFLTPFLARFVECFFDGIHLLRQLRYFPNVAVVLTVTLGSVEAVNELSKALPVRR